MSKVHKLKLLLDFWYTPHYEGKTEDWQRFCPNFAYCESSLLATVNFIVAGVEECDWSVLND